MQIVINISEDSYKATCNGYMLPPDVENVVQGIKNGTPLPKGHRGLIGVQDAVDNLMEYKEIGIFGNHDKRTILGCIDRIENHVEPIIKADKEEA